jgi:predicted RND superfamily exporter protein
MRIQYAGPRPTISQHGIQFKDGKEDKYVYLMIGVQILQAINKDYHKQSSYTYDIKTERVLDEDMLKIMLSFEPTLEYDTKIEIEGYKKHLESEIEHINQRAYLKDVEKEIWIKNLQLMKDYRIQRAVNKIYYMHCINNIKNIIMKKKLKEINTPFYEKYWHVLQTLQGNLESGMGSVRTELKIEIDKNEKMVAKLLINN